MTHEQKPLYTLTIEEFITLTKQLIAEAIHAGNSEEHKPSQHDAKHPEEMFTILELTH